MTDSCHQIGEGSTDFELLIALEGAGDLASLAPAAEGGRFWFSYEIFGIVLQTPPFACSRRLASSPATATPSGCARPSASSRRTSRRRPRRPSSCAPRDALVGAAALHLGGLVPAAGRAAGAGRRAHRRPRAARACRSRARARRAAAASAATRARG